MVEIYTDGRRPWLFTKHWTGSFGLSRLQRDAIRAVIRKTASSNLAFSGNAAASSVQPSALPERSRLSTESVKLKLEKASPWVKGEWLRINASLKPYIGDIREEKNGPGLKYLRTGRAEWLIRLHPKLNYIAIGFPNALREEVATTGWLREQLDAAWINFDPTCSKTTLDQLLRRATAR